MKFKTIKPVFNTIVMLGVAIFTGNTAVADVAVVSEVDGSVEKAHIHMVKIMDESEAQIALTLNRDLSLDVLGVRAGKQVEPCKKEKNNDCHFDQNMVFSEKTLTITVVKGSCCTYISTGNDTYEFCPPQQPFEFVNSISTENCPKK